MLEVGCGRGVLALALSRLGYRVDAIDPEAPAGDIFHAVSLEDFSDPGPFDAVIANLSIHHIPDLGCALAKLRRLLRPGGRLIVNEHAWDRFDERTARWYLEQRAATHPGAPSSLEQCLDKWAADHAGMHTSAAMRTELDRHFEERFFAWTPHLNRELGKAIDDRAELALIEAGAIQATGFRYVGERREDELQAFRNAAHALVDSVADHLAALPSRPVWQPLPDALRKQLLDLPLPEHPAALDDLVATTSRDVLPHAMGNGHPAFFGWVNPPPSHAGVMASLAAAAMNPSVVSGDHADVHLERAVVRWLAELVGFPHAPGAGLLTSGASAATIICFAGARSRALSAAGHDVRRDGLGGAPQLVAYVPAEAHSCVRRALELLGLGSGAMREVPLEGGQLDATALRASIATDRASGALPALLVGSAGTVNAGAIDPLGALADVATAEGLWFHVDGAYGAFGVLDPAIAARYRGMERADSLVLDPHKWLGVPVDAGCALVQRGDDLREAFSLIPPYLRQDADAPVGTFAEYGLEQTRPFRALKTWATIAARGRAGIAAQVSRANALARELATLVELDPELELAAAPETSIVAFRARPAGCPPARLDELNRELPEAVQARGRAFVTGTVFGGRETLRACILHPDTSSEHLATLVAEVVATARTLIAAE